MRNKNYLKKYTAVYTETEYCRVISGPKKSTIQFQWNGIRIDGRLFPCYMSISTMDRAPAAVTIYGRHYKDLPRIDGMQIENNSDLQSDYCENDRIRIEPGNIFFDGVFAAAIEAADHYKRIGEKAMERREKKRAERAELIKNMYNS